MGFHLLLPIPVTPTLLSTLHAAVSNGQRMHSYCEAFTFCAYQPPKVLISLWVPQNHGDGQVVDEMAGTAGVMSTATTFAHLRATRARWIPLRGTPIATFSFLGLAATAV